MKKILFFLVFSVIGLFSVQAQCPLTTAVDFTATDVAGVEHNLFDYLNSGKYVLIDFFFTTCSPCQATAPKINETYEHFGCNTADLIVLGIDNGNTDAQVITFDETYGTHYPAISGIEGGGNAICSSYGIPAYPTIILIAPDKSIVKQDIWPIATAQTLIDIITPYGPSEASCSGTASNLADVISFSIPNQVSTVIENEKITITVYENTDLSAVIPTFTISPNAKATFEGTEIISGTTAIDLSDGPDTLVVTAEDTTTIKNWVFKIQTIAGIGDIDNNEVYAYPNPSANEVNFANVQDADIILYNIMGVKVMEQHNYSSGNSIDISALPIGTYIAKLKMQNETLNIKINITK